MKILRQVSFSKKEEDRDKKIDEYFDKQMKSDAIRGAASSAAHLGIMYGVNRHFHKHNKAYTRKGDLKNAALWTIPVAAITVGKLAANKASRKVVKDYLKHVEENKKPKKDSDKNK